MHAIYQRLIKGPLTCSGRTLIDPARQRAAGLQVVKAPQAGGIVCFCKVRSPLIGEPASDATVTLATTSGSGQIDTQKPNKRPPGQGAQGAYEAVSRSGGVPG